MNFRIDNHVAKKIQWIKLQLQKEKMQDYLDMKGWIDMIENESTPII